ncbi:TATA box-binding protein-associated factor RNA polymerase I subunit B [Chionoecetes opilio]|uniref:TATA box-binding protein-associated factor RNA polymerase I subunit B n=1 Tax=Chionoecetes opilio TaxID=41210 RepID=A0A8J4YNE4_CHIOP|nr:TATA box-binding protein-associated factor RNA polymerase I subunit B [Chionoecetes opilio]
MPAVKEQCRVCGGDSFTTTHGLKVCDQCGRQEEHYIELLSQENIGEVDRSRLITTRRHDDAENAAQQPHPSDEKFNNWTTYEAYNSVLYEWTKALLSLGASPKVETITFKLWVAYLQRIGVAFSRKKKSFSQSSLRNSRDKKIIHEKAESVSTKSLYSFSRRKKRHKKAARTELDRIRDKIELKKMRNALKKGNDSSFMNTTLATELSKSLNDFEASIVSDSNSLSHAGDSKLNTSVKSDVTSALDMSSCQGPSGSGSDVDTDDAPRLPRKQIRRDNVVLNWIKRGTQIYGSHSEHEEEGKGATKDKMEEEGDEEIDDDCTSEVTTKKDHNSEQQNITKEKPVRKGKLKKPKYTKLYRKAARASNNMDAYRGAMLPFHLSFTKLLGILYLAVLLAEDHILLSDIIRWCREGHIPYLSAPYLLQSDMEVSYYDLFMLRNSKKLPDAEEMQAIAGRLAVFLNIQYVPMPRTTDIVRRFVKLLNLPGEEQVTTVAESLVKQVDIKKKGLDLPPIESMAMAAIILALKVYCGLDGHTEVMLSRAAAAISAKMPSQSSVTPFSWMDWQKHISHVVWVCCQVDPSTARHWQSLQDVRHFSPAVFSKYFWSEDMWRVPRTSWKKKVGLQLLTEELLRHQGQSLEEAITQPPLFQASQRPLCTTLEQLVQRDPSTQTDEMLSHSKVAEVLMDKSFTNHSLNWLSEMDYLTTELHKCGSKIQVVPTQRKGKAGISCKIQTYDDDHNTQGTKNNTGISTQELFIRQPLKNVWKINHECKYNTWEKLSPFLPLSYRWLVGVTSNICETSKMQLQSHVSLLQRRTRKRKH